jgi:hypothetical protein
MLDLEIDCRGLTSLVEDWRDDDQVKQIWHTEDLIAKFMKLMECLLVNHDHFREHGRFPHPEVRYSHLVDLIRSLLPIAAIMEESAKTFEEGGHHIDGLNKLRSDLIRLRSIVEEDEWPTRAALAGGALDDRD